MVSQYGIKYAVHIINTHFGELVSKVCECLLRRGPLTLQQAVQFTELSPQQVKNSLLVLIQHNCVQAFCVEQPGGIGREGRVLTQYIALFDNILHRMRFSKFLLIVSEELDKFCVDLFEGLLQHGRLTVKQMLDRARGNQMLYDAIQESLNKLVSARFVERCPVSEPLLAAPSDETPAKRRGAKSAKINQEPESIEHRVLAAAAPMEAKRFSLLASADIAVNEKGNDDIPSAVGGKRKRDETSSDNNNGFQDEENVLWRVNFEKFIRLLRHKACVENVKVRYDEGAATVLGAILEATRTLESKVKTENSVPLSINSIFEEVMKSEAGRSMTLDRVRFSLVQLGGLKGADDLYTVDLKNIIEQAQNEEVESLVLKKYGRDAYRMFRLLTKTGKLMETDKISETTFVEKKDAPRILYNLWKDEYLHMEKAEINQYKKFLLWKVHKQTLREHVLDDMYHAALNLSQRLAYEKEEEKELFLLPADKRVGPLKERIDRLKRAWIILESSMMTLDDAIMLFHDF